MATIRFEGALARNPAPKVMTQAKSVVTPQNENLVNFSPAKDTSKREATSQAAKRGGLQPRAAADSLSKSLGSKSAIPRPVTKVREMPNFAAIHARNDEMKQKKLAEAKKEIKVAPFEFANRPQPVKSAVIPTPMAAAATVSTASKSLPPAAMTQNTTDASTTAQQRTSLYAPKTPQRMAASDDFCVDDGALHTIMQDQPEEDTEPTERLEMASKDAIRRLVQQAQYSHKSQVEDHAKFMQQSTSIVSELMERRASLHAKLHKPAASQQVTDHPTFTSTTSSSSAMNPTREWSQSGFMWGETQITMPAEEVEQKRGSIYFGPVRVAKKAQLTASASNVIFQNAPITPSRAAFSTIATGKTPILGTNAINAYFTGPITPARAHPHMPMTVGKTPLSTSRRQSLHANHSAHTHHAQKQLFGTAAVESETFVTLAQIEKMQQEEEELERELAAELATLQQKKQLQSNQIEPSTNAIKVDNHKSLVVGSGSAFASIGSMEQMNQNIAKQGQRARTVPVTLVRPNCGLAHVTKSIISQPTLTTVTTKKALEDFAPDSVEPEFSWEVHCITSVIAEQWKQGRDLQIRLENPVARLFSFANSRGLNTKLRGHVLLDDVFCPVLFGEEN